MCSTSIFPCIMTMICNFTIYFIFQIFIFKFFFANTTDFCIFMNLAALLIITSFFFFLENLLFSLRDLLRIHKTFPCNLYLCIHHNEDIVDIEKPGGICSFTFVVDEILGLFLRPSVFSIIHSRSA